jgi:hypothetical protein
MDGNFSKYATTSAGDIVRVSVATLIGRASTLFADTRRYGFCHSLESASDRYLEGSAAGMRFFSVDASVRTTVCKLVGCAQESKAIAAAKRQVPSRAMDRILA